MAFNGRISPKRFRRAQAQGYAPFLVGAPTDCAVFRDDASLTAVWRKPDSKGQTINNYIVSYSSDGGSNWTVASSSVTASDAYPEYTITGLTNGTTYIVSIQAVTWKAGYRGLTGSVAPAPTITYTTTGSPLTETNFNRNSHTNGVGYKTGAVKFTGSGTITFTTNPSSTDVNHTLLAGGGGAGRGGASYGGGGGGGGQNLGSVVIGHADITGNTLTVTVGGGGTAGLSGATPGNGTDSTIANSGGASTIYSYRGGRGGNGWNGAGPEFSSASSTYGSGGGGIYGGQKGTSGSGSGTNDGGEGASNWSYGARVGGGGGGAGGTGYNGYVYPYSGGSSYGGNGGTGVYSSHGSFGGTIGGGGAGGGMYNNGGPAWIYTSYGSGGGGQGKTGGYYGVAPQADGTAGTANTGGGGGSGSYGGDGGAGGSGVAIFSWDL